MTMPATPRSPCAVRDRAIDGKSARAQARPSPIAPDSTRRFKQRAAAWRPAFLAYVAGWVVLGAAHPSLGQDPPAASATDEGAATDTVGDEAPTAISAEEAIASALRSLDAIDQGADAAESLKSAAEMLKIAAGSAPGDARLLWISGRIRLLTGQGVDAIREIRAYTQSPQGRNDWIAFRTLGDALAGQYASLAAAEYKKAYALNDQDPRVLIGLSRTARAQGRAAEARLWAQRATQLPGGRRIEFLTYYGQLLREAGNASEALKVAAAALEQAKAIRRDNLADAAALTVLETQYQVYMVFLRDAIAAAPGNAEFYLLFARAGEELGEIEMLIQWHNVRKSLAHGLETLGDEAPLTMHLEHARVTGAIGLIDEAIAEYEEIIAAHADHAEAKSALEALRALKSDAPPEP